MSGFRQLSDLCKAARICHSNQIAVHLKTHLSCTAFPPHIFCYALILVHRQCCIQKFRLGGVIVIESPKKLSDHDFRNNIGTESLAEYLFKVHVCVVYPLSFHSKIVKKYGGG